MNPTPALALDTLTQRGAAAVLAILRGIEPADAVAIARSIVDAGIGALEITLNSPRALHSIAAVCEAVGSRAVVGAGTVLRVAEVESALSAGAAFIVSPNTDPDVIRRTLSAGAESLPGFATASEAFVALSAGAHNLKLFPAATYGLRHLAALREVLPVTARIWAVGGVGAADLRQWVAHGAAGIGMGSALYRAGDSSVEVAAKAANIVAALKTALPSPRVSWSPENTTL